MTCGMFFTGHCCASGGNGTPFCENAACCEAVCAVDPYCCEVEWDECCAKLAQQECSNVMGCGPASCVGFCGTISTGGCWCDEACCDFVDCCIDKEFQCGGVGCITIGGCHLHCGLHVWNCSCHPDCFDLGMCCQDVCKECPQTPGCNPADLTGNNLVAVTDLLLLLHGWGECDPPQCPHVPGPEDCPADYNGDGVVNVVDLLYLLENWGGQPLPTPGSCEGVCGGVSVCWCDESCCAFQDCCPDKFEQCGGCEPTPRPGSCEGVCGGESDCWCDEACCSLQDCCPDKFEQCGGCQP